MTIVCEKTIVRRRIEVAAAISVTGHFELCAGLTDHARFPDNALKKRSERSTVNLQLESS